MWTSPPTSTIVNSITINLWKFLYALIICILWFHFNINKQISLAEALNFSVTDLLIIYRYKITWRQQWNEWKTGMTLVLATRLKLSAARESGLFIVDHFYFKSQKYAIVFFILAFLFKFLLCRMMQFCNLFLDKF